MNAELTSPVVVDFPLRGEGWSAVTSPADRVPSHGTDVLGQRFAFDFLITDERRGGHYHPAGWLRTVLIGVPTRECYAWGRPVHAPFGGEVIRAADGFGERERVHPIREAVLAIRTALTFSVDRLADVMGNYVLIQSGDLVAGLVHLAPGSVTVAEGENVETGDLVGRVGHTGNSTSPHLHFQLMDNPDPVVARGVPCAFRTYEVQRDGVWAPAVDGIPRRTDRLRVIDPAMERTQG